MVGGDLSSGCPSKEGERSEERPLGSPEEGTSNEARNSSLGGRYCVSFLTK